MTPLISYWLLATRKARISSQVFSSSVYSPASVAIGPTLFDCVYLSIRMLPNPRMIISPSPKQQPQKVHQYQFCRSLKRTVRGFGQTGEVLGGCRYACEAFYSNLFPIFRPLRTQGQPIHLPAAIKGHLFILFALSFCVFAFSFILILAHLRGGATKDFPAAWRRRGNFSLFCVHFSLRIKGSREAFTLIFGKSLLFFAKIKRLLVLEH